MARDTPISEYLRKQRGFRLRLDTPPEPALGLVVVIPCKDEPALTDTLASLARSERPPCAVEVIVVVNASAEDPAEVRARCAANAREARELAALTDIARLRWHVIEELALAERHAGVGLARKLGMDEAAARLQAAGAATGVIACLDGDATVDGAYLAELWRWFEAHPRADGASIHFEHPFEQLSDSRHRAGIVGYELFLRCHVHGLRLAGHPGALHTVGSSMAVRALAYAIHGGMNRRKAGEDFYFLHKLAEHGAVGEIRDTTVFPSARVSDRVPFGTGRAIGDWLVSDERDFLAYDARVYQVLADIVRRVEPWWADRDGSPLAGMEPCVAEFLVAEGFPEALDGLRANATTLDSFRARFFAWLSPFRALKLIHHLTRALYPKRPVTEVAAEILRASGDVATDELRRPLDAVELLRTFRSMDRNHEPEGSLAWPVPWRTDG